MANDFTSLERRIAQIRNLPGVIKRAAPAVARTLEAELRRNIAGGVAPDGSPWPATSDGRQPLRGAAAALEVRVVGTDVVAKVSGVEALHDRGEARGGKRRRILPTGALPPAMAESIDRVIVEEMRRELEGDRR